jgi:hypothetical protein
MIDLISPDGVTNASLLVLDDHLVLIVVASGELVDDEFLHGDNINDIVLGFDIVKDENTQLVCNAAEIKVLQHEDH